MTKPSSSSSLTTNPTPAAQKTKKAFRGVVTTSHNKRQKTGGSTTGFRSNSGDNGSSSVSKQDGQDDSSTHHHHSSPFAGTGFQTASSLLLLSNDDDAAGSKGEDDDVMVVLQQQRREDNNDNNHHSPMRRRHTNNDTDASPSSSLLRQQQQQDDLGKEEEETETSSTVVPPRPVSFNLKIKGVNHHADWRDIINIILQQRDDAVIMSLDREPTNEHDPNAIAVVVVVLVPLKVQQQQQEQQQNDSNSSSNSSNKSSSSTDNKGSNNNNDDDDNKKKDDSTGSCSLDDTLSSSSSSPVNNKKKKMKIGYVDRHQAELLAPLLDNGRLLQFETSSAAGTTTTTTTTTMDMVRCFRTTLAIRVTLTSTMTDDEVLAFLMSRQQQVRLGTDMDAECNESSNFSRKDWETSLAAPYTLLSNNDGAMAARILPWNPISTTTSCSHVSKMQQRGKPAARATAPPTTTTSDKLEHGWTTASDDSLCTAITTISDTDRQKQSAWPPSDNVLSMLGLGGSQDKAWWAKTAGLLPPCEWMVNGAHDLISSSGEQQQQQQQQQQGLSKNKTVPAHPPPVALQSATQVQRAKEALDGAIHGVTNVWTEESLDDMRNLMHSDYFWLNRKGGESFIRTFGGPYVLGQNEDDLHLILGAEHNETTARICRAHNLVYTAVHLELPAAPGFNSIIFGLNRTGSGFHYHQDSIAELEGKNAPLIPKQPVVTTVFYEKPAADSGKECVFWKPVLNFTPRAATAQSMPKKQSDDDDEESLSLPSSSMDHDAQQQAAAAAAALYLAARALPTVHGQVHVQRAGLQKVAQHGIFHTPSSKSAAVDQHDESQEEDYHHGPRTGYRVAITARITHVDAMERIRPFLQRGVYQGVMGPNGNLTLPARTGTTTGF